MAGAHLNSVVSLGDATFGGLRWRDAAAYLPAQVAGCVSGAVVANIMFDRAAVSISTHHHRGVLSNSFAGIAPSSGVGHPSALEQRMIDTREHVDEITEKGWTVIPGAIDADLLSALAQDLDRLERELQVVPADNDFEGRNTKRIYNLLARSELWWQVPIHPSVLPVVEGVLDRGCLVSSLSSINIGPGETAQPIHADDQLIPIPKPHPATVCNTMWALTDFTEANGATRLVSGSHTADSSPVYGQHYDSVPAEMEKGSVLVWHGSLWHGGGANQTDRQRIGVAMNYCAGYIRQQENQQLGIPGELVARMPERLQQLVGYGIYNGLIGHIDKQSPASLLDRRPPDGNSMVWDAAG